VTASTLGVTVACLALGLATVFGLARRARDGRPRAVSAPDPPGYPFDRLGVVPGTPATLVQFSSAFCAPCRTARLVCADVAATVTGVRHVEVDADSHLDAVRALRIRRTPTVLVVDGAGRVVRRAVGAPTRAQLLAAVGELTA
jgi:thiol-disulfide isomerase/thioredoxin